MSEHQECYPLPVNCNMGKGRIEFADGKLLCTMPPTCVNESWEYKRDLILNSVNNYDRLRKANEELAKACESALAWILLGNHEEAPGWIEARDLLAQALKSAESK